MGASNNRNGYPTDAGVFAALKDAIAELDAFEKYPELAAKTRRTHAIECD